MAVEKNARRLPAVWMAVAATLIELGGCATSSSRNAADPLEPMNRAVFHFNEGLDRKVAKPAAKAYLKVTPSPIRTAVSNVFSNLGDLGNLTNNLLQLKITDATEDLMRFTFNSTFGLGGTLDWASAAGLPKHNQDFGLTLGHYGLPPGPYLVLPLFGPSSARDATGWAFSMAVSPTTYMTAEASVPLFGVNVVSSRANMLGATSLIEQAALDRYTFIRDGYLQRRAYLLHDGSSLPVYGDPDDGPASVHALESQHSVTSAGMPPTGD